MIEKRKLGSTGIEVARIGISSSFGAQADVFRAALDRGWRDGMGATVSVLLDLARDLCPGASLPALEDWRNELEKLLCRGDAQGGSSP